MANTYIQITAFPQPVQSTVNQPCGFAIRPKSPFLLSAVGYSFIDTGGVYNPATDAIVAQLFVVQGIYSDPVNFFSPTITIPAQYRILYQTAINTAGPVLIPFFNADNTTTADAGAGLSVLLSFPIVTLGPGHVGTPLMVGTLFATGITQNPAVINEGQHQGPVPTGLTSGDSGRVSTGGGSIVGPRL